MILYSPSETAFIVFKISFKFYPEYVNKKYLEGLKGEYSNPANVYFVKINSRNTRKASEICSKIHN